MDIACHGMPCHEASWIWLVADGLFKHARSVASADAANVLVCLPSFPN